MNRMGAFEPRGKTVAIASTSTAANGVAVPCLSTDDRANQFSFYNAGNTFVTVAYAAVNTDSANACVAATGAGANSKSSFPIPVGGPYVVTAPTGQYWSCNSTVNCTVYITPGCGL